MSGPCPAHPTAHALWCQADREHPHDPKGRRIRYRELMHKHGHIIDRQPGDDRPLFPCGYQPKPTEAI